MLITWLLRWLCWGVLTAVLTPLAVLVGSNTLLPGVSCYNVNTQLTPQVLKFNTCVRWRYVTRGLTSDVSGRGCQRFVWHEWRGRGEGRRRRRTDMTRGRARGEAGYPWGRDMSSPLKSFYLPRFDLRPWSFSLSLLTIACTPKRKCMLSLSPFLPHFVLVI